MRKAIKWVFGIVGVLLILVVVGGALGYAFLMRTLPEDNGSVRMAGLGDSVSVTRDNLGVPHIQGKTLFDVAAAQGYIHAQERLWQMETFRMAGQGRLSEMFGDKTVETDKFLRTLNLSGHSKASFEKLLPKTQKILQAYVKGINAYIDREKRMFEPALPVEFMILGHAPERWEAWQSLMTVKVMALTLGSNLSNEIRRLALASKGFSSNEIDDLVRYHSKDYPPALPDLRKLYGFAPSGKIQNSSLENKNLLTQLADQRDIAWPIGVTASNNWVVSGEHTKSGKVLLANDPHLGLTAPSIWYLVHLSWEEDGERTNLVGASMPSIPLIMLGRNDKVAWGFTTSVLDSQDLYVERINPENEDEYLTQNGWQKFTHSSQVIKVKGADDVTYDIRSTRHGPVLPIEYKNLNRYLPDNHVGALKWIAMTDDDTSMDALIGFASSKSVSGLINSTRSLLSPMQSIVIGDVEGNIGFIAPSRVAVRSPENLIKGRAPVPGWMPKYEWQEFLQFEDLPQEINPTEGILFSANSKFVGYNYKHHITYDWAEEFRHDRVEKLIVKHEGKRDVALMRSTQADAYSPALVKFRQELLAQMPSGVSTNNGIMPAIKSWDGKMARDEAVPLIMMSWFKAISEALLKDDLGEDFELFDRGRMSVVLGLISGGGARDWCDNRKSPGKQTCADIAQTSFETAIKTLKEVYGEDWKTWKWGKAHIAYGQHRPFAKVPPLDKLFNVEIESAGGPYTLLRGQTDFGEDKPYLSRHASSYRAIYDFADLNKSLYIQTTGQSGNFLSRFYSNFAQKWADVDYIKISTVPAEYEKNAVGVWIFEQEQ